MDLPASEEERMHQEVMGEQEMMGSTGASAGPGWPTLAEQRSDGKEIAMHLARYGGTRDERSIFPASRLSNPLVICERVLPGSIQNLDGRSCPPPSESTLFVGC